MAGVNSGYLLALCTQALGQALSFPDPLVASGFYLRPGSHGPGEIRTSVLRTGMTTAFGQASLWQDGRERVRVTAVFTDLPGRHPLRGRRLSREDFEIWDSTGTLVTQSRQLALLLS